MKSYKAIMQQVIEQSYTWDGSNGIAINGGWRSFDGLVKFAFERWDVRAIDSRHISLWLDNSLDEELVLEELAFLIPTPVYCPN